MIENLKPYTEYKESGLPWLGEVPGHWEVRKPMQIGVLMKGVGGTKEDSLSEGIPCVRYGELYTTHTFFIQKPKAYIHPSRISSYTPIKYGDVLFAASGETLEDIGKSAVNLIRETTVCGGDVIVLRPNSTVHAPFLGYALDCYPAAVQKAMMGRGTTVKHIYPDELKNLLFPLPPPAEQAAIVRFLDWANHRLERAIRAKRKVIALLNEQKQAIIHRAVTRGLDPNVRLKDSGIPWLGEIPEHWEVRRLRHLIKDRLTYGANAAAEFDNKDWPRYIRITDFRYDGTLKKDTFRSLPPSIAKDYMVQVGDILFARSGATVGKAFLVKAFTGDACHAGYLIRARPDYSMIVPEYLYAFTQSKSFASWKDSTFNSATIQNIGADKYANLHVPFPEIFEQQTILNHIESEEKPLSTTISRLEREITLLREYRTRLISDVVTGKLDVREAAARLPEEVPLETETDTDDTDPGEEADIPQEDNDL